MASTTFSRRDTVGWGSDAPTPIAEGLLDLSMVWVLCICVVVYNGSNGEGEVSKGERERLFGERLVIYNYLKERGRSSHLAGLFSFTFIYTLFWVVLEHAGIDGI